MWKVISASVIGASHGRAGTPCQDSCDVLRLKSDNDELLLVAVADGAGSASHSHIGSKEAAQYLLTVIPHTQLNFKQITQEQVRGWMQEVLNHLTAVSERERLPLNQLACTLLLGIVAPNGAVFAQIGDGAWVVEKDGELIPATWPQNGEYANITTFITTESALNSMYFVRLTGTISAFAGFSDGLQALALCFATRQAHAPFFKPMFDSVRTCNDGTDLIAPLRGFLASEFVNSRTDDDKTLVLACWSEPGGVFDEAGE